MKKAPPRVKRFEAEMILVREERIFRYADRVFLRVWSAGRHQWFLRVWDASETFRWVLRDEKEANQLEAAFNNGYELHHTGRLSQADGVVTTVSKKAPSKDEGTVGRSGPGKG